MSHPLPHHPDSDDDDDDEEEEEEDFEAIVMKPKPRPPFELSSPPPSTPSTPVSSSYLQAPSSFSNNMDAGTTTPAKSRSFLNLTTSTLFGIYQQTGFSTERDDSATASATPWGTGAQTPARSSRGENSLDLSRADKALSNPNGNPSFTTQTRTRTRRRRRSSAAAPARPTIHRKPRRGFRRYYLPLIARLVTLFGIGVLYGLLITHLHDRQELAPAKVDINRSSWTYLTWWGLAGAALGVAMPWVDTFWAPDDDDDDNNDDEETSSERGGEKEDERSRRRRRSGLTHKQRGAAAAGGRGRGRGGALDPWIDIVRSIGAFVGIAYAIRKLPWQSPLQLSLTLALANPAIWFIVDRSPPGFVLSTCFALAGTLVLLGLNPALMPEPSPAEVLRAHVLRNGGLRGRASAFGNGSGSAGGRASAAAAALTSEELIWGIFTQDSVGVATWIASVLFVSSVCFGNIGRRLAPAQ